MREPTPTHRQLQRTRAYLVVVLVSLGFLLCLAIYSFLTVNSGQNQQNSFSIFSRRENRATLASLGNQVENSRRQLATLNAALKKANVGKSNAEQTTRVLATQLETQRRFFSAELATGLGAAVRNVRADVAGQVAKLGGQVRALETEVGNTRQANRIQVDAQNQLQAVYRDSLAVVSNNDRRELEAIRVIDYAEPRGWFTVKGSISESMNFTPNFYSRYRIHFSQQRGGGVLGLFGRRIYSISVVDLNPYNRTDSVGIEFEDRGFDQEIVVPLTDPSHKL